MNSSNLYPLDYFPPLLKGTVRDVSIITKAPIELICSSILGCISLACQNIFNVQITDTICCPTSLYLITIAESGERKSSVDQLLLKPIYETDKNQQEIFNKNLTIYQNINDIHLQQRKYLLSQLKHQMLKCKDISNIENAILKLEETKPSKPAIIRLIFGDTTPAALKEYLMGKWNSVGLIADEGGCVFNSTSLDDLPFFNKLWDGSTICIDRKNTRNFLIDNARMTISLMVQPSVLQKYINKKGELAKGNGFFARTLICSPISTQGNRHIIGDIHQSQETLNLFHSRLHEILTLSVINKPKFIITLSAEAKKAWINFYNECEDKIKIHPNMKDFISKMPIHVGRIAALLHFFENGLSEISATTINAAEKIVIWYFSQHLTIFTDNESSCNQTRDADELEYWIRNYTNSYFHIKPTKTTILQYGPNKFRKRDVLNNTLIYLVQQRKIVIQKIGKTEFICCWNQQYIHN